MNFSNDNSLIDFNDNNLSLNEAHDKIFNYMNSNPASHFDKNIFSNNFQNIFNKNDLSNDNHLDKPDNSMAISFGAPVTINNIESAVPIANNLAIVGKPSVFNKPEPKSKVKKEKVAKHRSLVNSSLDRYMSMAIDTEIPLDITSIQTRVMYKAPEVDYTKILETENDKFIADFKEFKFHAKGLGLVCYLSPSHYHTNPVDNLNVDFNLTKVEFAQFLLHWLVKEKEVPLDLIESIVVGHEYTPTTNKCHYQCGIFLNKPLSRTWKASEFIYKGLQYVFTLQKAKNSANLNSYCQKDNDCVVIGSDSRLFVVKFKTNGKGEEVPDVPGTIVANSNKDPIELEKFLFTKFPGYLGSNYNNINRMITTHCSETLPELAWNIPEYLRNSTNSLHIPIVNALDNYFINQVETRSKALIIYGPQGCGKTMLAKALVNHPSYYAYFRSSFTKEEAHKLKTAKLLIMDDFTFMEKKQIELYKALFSGEEVTLECKYYQSPIKAGYRTIFCTNNIDFCKMIYSTSEFDGRYVMCGIEDAERDYLGPPATYRQDLTQSTSHSIDPLVKAYFDESRGQRNNSSRFTDLWKNKLTTCYTEVGLPYFAGNFKLNPSFNPSVKVEQLVDAPIQPVVTNNSYDSFLNKKTKREIELENENFLLKEKITKMELMMQEQNIKLNLILASLNK